MTTYDKYRINKPLILLLFIGNIFIITTLLKIVQYDFSERKILVLVGNIFFICLFIFIYYKKGIENILYYIIILFPFWIRGMYYFGFDILPNGFNYLTMDIVIFFLVCFILVLKTLRKKKLYINNTIIYLFILSIIYFSASMFNIWLRNGITNLELEVFLINFIFPIFILLSLYLYLLNTSENYRLLFIKGVYYFYIVILLYAVVELFIKGHSLLINPSLFLEYGLRQPSSNDGSQIISGGIRDILYFSFIQALMPIYGIVFYRYRIITLRTYKILLFTSLFFVFSIYSKGPIILYIINIYLANKILKFFSFKNLIYITPFIIGLILLTGAKLFERITKFTNVLSLLSEGDSDGAINEESSAANRLIHMLTRYQEFTQSPWLGKSELTFTNDIFIYLLSSYGIFITFIILLILYKIYLSLNDIGRYIFISFFIFSLVELSTIFGVGGYTLYTLNITQEQYINIYGWLPFYSNGNVYVSLFLILIGLLNYKKVY